MMGGLMYAPLGGAGHYIFSWEEWLAMEVADRDCLVEQLVERREAEAKSLRNPGGGGP